MSERIPKSQAAALARVSEKTIERGISEGELTAEREHGRVMIDAKSLGRWMEARKNRGRRLSNGVPSHVERAIGAEIQALTEAR